MDRAEAERTISLREITPLLHTRNFVLRVTAHARTAAQGLGGYGRFWCCRPHVACLVVMSSVCVCPVAVDENLCALLFLTMIDLILPMSVSPQCL